MIKTIFLDNKTKPILNNNDNFNIILSSKLYWVRLFDIPIESKKDVLAVVPTLFEDFFDIDGYKFFSIKIEEFKYLCFAYKKQDILDALQRINIDIKKVINIYFAQNEFQSLAIDNTVIQYEDNYYIYQNDILVKIPNNMVSLMSSITIDINNITLSKHKFSIHKTSKYIDNRSAYILSVIFILFSLGVFFKTFIINKTISSYDLKKQTLKTKYNLMSSTIQTKSVLKQYEKIIQKNKITRDALQDTINFKQKVNGKLEKVEFNNGNLNISISNGKLQPIKKYFGKKYQLNHSNINNNIVKIEFKI